MNQKHLFKKSIVALLFAMVSFAAWADDSGSCGENVTYTFVESTGTLTISGTGAMGAMQHPWYDKGYKWAIKKIVIEEGVTRTSPEAFYGCYSLTSVVLPSTLVAISPCAFENCTALESVSIPNSVFYIGDLAFARCTSLKNINIPSSVTMIGGGAFAENTSLETINVAKENDSFVFENGVLYSKDKTVIVQVLAGVSGAFEIPSTVTTIEDDAFYECSGLTSVSIPNSVTTIGENAFYACSGLTSITIPNSVTSIGDDAFGFCTSLESITCEATTPPACDGDITNRTGTKIYVPAGSVDAYSGTNAWGSLNVQVMPSTVVAERAIAEKAGAKKIMPNGFVYIEADGVKFGLSGNKLR